MGEWYTITLSKTTVIVVVCVLVIALLVIIVLTYIFQVHIPGLNGKNLWDWLQLLIIPAVLAVGGYLFNYTTSRTEREIASDRQREDALRAYIDNMSELLLIYRLRDSKEDDEVRKIARVRTITILFQLDARRIGYVFSFLREAGLMSNQSDNSIVNMNQADLRKINLSQADLSQANLSSAYLNRANLSGANLNEANLHNANLNDANLNEAYLWGANLSQTYLIGANLRKANLEATDLQVANLGGADLSGANLYGANLGQANLGNADLREADLRLANLEGVTGISNEELEKQAKLLKGAIMPDGTKHD